MMTKQDEKRLRELLGRECRGTDFGELAELQAKDSRRYAAIYKEEQVSKKALEKATDR